MIEILEIIRNSSNPRFHIKLAKICRERLKSIAFSKLLVGFPPLSIYYLAVKDS